MYHILILIYQQIQVFNSVAFQKLDDFHGKTGIGTYPITKYSNRYQSHYYYVVVKAYNLPLIRQKVINLTKALQSNFIKRSQNMKSVQLPKESQVKPFCYQTFRNAVN